MMWIMETKLYLMAQNINKKKWLISNSLDDSDGPDQRSSLVSFFLASEWNNEKKI